MSYKSISWFCYVLMLFALVDIATSSEIVHTVKVGDAIKSYQTAVNESYAFFKIHVGNDY